MAHEIQPETLNRLLRDLHDSLLAGRFDAVVQKVPELERAAEAALADGLTRELAQDLQASARALDLALRAALEGIKAARRRIEALKAVHHGLQSYDDKGKALRIATVPAKAARRL